MAEGGIIGGGSEAVRGRLMALMMPSAHGDACACRALPSFSGVEMSTDGGPVFAVTWNPGPLCPMASAGAAAGNERAGVEGP